jgi:hypothetical protein
MKELYRKIKDTDRVIVVIENSKRPFAERIR